MKNQKILFKNQIREHQSQLMQIINKFKDMKLDRDKIAMQLKDSKIREAPQLKISRFSGIFLQHFFRDNGRSKT